jgi:hypothetical protein
VYKLERMKYIKISVSEMLEIAKDTTKLQKYIDEANQCVKVCEGCGNNFFTIRPDSAKYCDECNTKSIAVKLHNEKNIEKVRAQKREWARKNKNRLKKVEVTNV